MGNPLHARRTPQEFATTGQVIEITNKISEFEKLTEIVAADLSALDPAKLPSDWRAATVAGQLDFGFADAQGATPAVAGQVAVTIDAVCQRCLQAFKLPLRAELRLLFADVSAGDEEGYEVWELDENDVCPADLIEEALIMTIPFVAMHDDDDANCVQVNVAAGKTEKTILPFANLKAQMKQEN